MSCPTAGGTAMQNGRPYARGRERERLKWPTNRIAEALERKERKEEEEGGRPAPSRPPPRSRSANIVFGREKIRAAGCFFAATAAAVLRVVMEDELVRSSYRRQSAE